MTSLSFPPPNPNHGRCVDCNKPKKRGNGHTRRCAPCHMAMFRREGSLRRAGFDSLVAQAMASAGYAVVGSWPVVDCGVAS